MPASLMRLAAHPPEAPEPTTIASYSCGRIGFCMRTPYSLRGFVALYCGVNAAEKEIVMSDLSNNAGGPLRHFRVGRRAVLQSLATGVGAAVFASQASAAHVHQAAAVATQPEVPTGTLLFLDQHSFDTLA